MGNCHNKGSQQTQSHSNNKLSKWFKQWQENKKPVIRSDDFIIKYNRFNKINNPDITFLDERRVVFVSLIGAYQTWRQCPSYVLYPAIFLIPMKREWIYQHLKYTNEIRTSLICDLNMFSDVNEVELFITMLKWKDSQGLVFWMIDEYKYKTETLIHPFWQHFNQKLTNLYDPISESKYNKLNLNDKEWKNKIQTANKYCSKTASILCELYFLPMKYKCLQEIIFQSNPKSLIPIQAYGMECNIFSNKRFDLYKDFDNTDKIQNWWISEDYDPFDLN